jgi:predicted transcriptional regulator
MNQHGFLKSWRITGEGTYVDDQKISDVKIGDLEVAPWQATRIRIGTKPDAVNKGGFTLFGKGFGSFEQDLILKVHHSTRGGDLPENVKRGV